MELEWDTVRALGAVTAVCLPPWATWRVPAAQARRGAPWGRTVPGQVRRQDSVPGWGSQERGRMTGEDPNQGRGGGLEAPRSKRCEGRTHHGKGGMESPKLHR